MKQIILKPLDFSDDSDIELLGSDLLNQKKIIFLYGNKKVGKTALFYKLMTQQNYVPFIIGLDRLEVYEYWNKKIDKSIPFFIDRKEPLNPLSLTLKVDKILGQAEENGVKINLIVLDGIDQYHEDLLQSNSSLARIKSLLKNLINTARVQNATIIIISENKLDLIDSDNYDVQIENWHLIRPEYIAECIKEYGETKLIIESR